jgi:cytidyltransferase-like protein
MNSKIYTYQLAADKCKDLKKNGKKIIFKSGCFDLLHAAHVRMLEHARNCADVLVVGVGSNESVAKSRPHTFFDENNRAYVIASLQCVDMVVIEKEEIYGNIDHAVLLRHIQPDYFHIASDDKHLDTKKIMALTIGAHPIIFDPVSIINYGQEIEPHSSTIKKSILAQ